MVFFRKSTICIVYRNTVTGSILLRSVPLYTDFQTSDGELTPNFCHISKDFHLFFNDIDKL